MGLVFNPFTGNFDFTGSSGGGGGTISGTIAATQVAFGTGADTIGGDSDFTWIDPTLNFTSGKGLSFDGTKAPITMVGGDDGAGDTAIIIDNPTDNYTTLVFPSYTDIFATTLVEIISPDQLNGVGVNPDGINLFADVGNLVEISGQTTLTPNLSRKNQGIWFNTVFSGDTEENVIHYEQWAQPDSASDKFESSIGLGAVTPTGTTKNVTFLGTEGHYTALGVMTDYEMFWYDNIRSGAILRIDSVTDATTLQVGADYRVAVVREVASQTGFELVNGAVLRTDTTTAHTGLIQAYDVDGAAYKTFATLTNGNTPSFDISFPAGGTASGNFTTLQVNSVAVATTADVADVSTLAWLGLN